MFDSNGEGIEAPSPLGDSSVKDRKNKTDQLSLATQLWGINWQDLIHGYGDLMPGVRLKFGNDAQVNIFLSENKGPDGAPSRERFQFNAFHPSKSAFLKNFCDEFAIIDTKLNIIIGVVICQVTDWSTYYIRYVFLREDQRGRGIFQNFLTFLFKALGENSVERLEIEVSPLNGVQFHTLNKMGFYVSATSMTDRWGCVLKFTKFLAKDAVQTFVNQFCGPPLGGPLDFKKVPRNNQ